MLKLNEIKNGINKKTDKGILEEMWQCVFIILLGLPPGDGNKRLMSLRLDGIKQHNLVSERKKNICNQKHYFRIK